MPTPRPTETQIAISEINNDATAINVTRSRRLGGKALELVKGLARPDLEGANVVRGNLAQRGQDIAAVPERGEGVMMEDMGPSAVARAFALRETVQDSHGTLPQIQEAQDDQSKYH